LKFLVSHRASRAGDCKARWRGDALERHYPSVWTNHTRASAKVHVIMNGTTRTPERVCIAPGSSHDLPLMRLEACCIGSLYLFDLAYYQGKLFRRIIERGGHFLCRVKKDANFRIVDTDNPHSVGRRHKSILAEMSGRYFDVWIDYAYRHLPERDWSWRHLELRLIAVWSPELQRHRLYLTSAPVFALPINVAAEVYAVRWEIELLFRELKSQLRLDHMPSGNKAAAECMLYASILALAFDRTLRRDLAARDDLRIPAERSSILFRSVAPLLLDLLVGVPAHRLHLERVCSASKRPTPIVDVSRCPTALALSSLHHRINRSPMNRALRQLRFTLRSV
jgi:putative transposase